MLPNTLAELLKLSASERVEIAMALWESLSDAERKAELALTPEQEAELDHRLAEHIANPDSAIPWDDVRRRLVDRSIAPSQASCGILSLIRAFTVKRAARSCGGFRTGSTFAPYRTNSSCWQ